MIEAKAPSSLNLMGWNGKKSLVFLVAILAVLAVYYFYKFYNYTLNYSDVFDELCNSSGNKKSLLDNPGAVSASYAVVVIVLSRPGATERRNAIRNTWMKPYRSKLSKILVSFSVGTSGLSADVLRHLSKEQGQYGDLILLGNVVESYENLTNKVLATFVAANEKFNFSYLLKCDDDTFVALDIIAEELIKRKSKRSYYWGKMFEKSGVRTTGKFAETKWFLSSTYIPYALGAAYILSGDLVTFVALHHNKLVQYKNEDVSVSVWISPLDVERRHDNRICEIKPFTYYGCRKHAIILHHVSASEMLMLQRAYHSNRRIC